MAEITATNNFNSAKLSTSGQSQKLLVAKQSAKPEATRIKANEEFFKFVVKSKSEKTIGKGILGDVNDAYTRNQFFNFRNRERQPILVYMDPTQTKIPSHLGSSSGIPITATEPDTTLKQYDSPENAIGDNSVPPMLTQNIDRNNSETHQEITDSLLVRTSWVNEPKIGSDDVFDLDFGKILDQSVLQKIRQTSGQSTTQIHDTLMETLRDIYYLTPEDIAKFDEGNEKSYLRDALVLITEDIKNRVNLAGDDVQKGLLSFSEMVMHYSSNDKAFGTTLSGLPDHGKWLSGDFKIGFILDAEGNLGFPNPIKDMILTTANSGQTLLLKFTTANNSVQYDIAYNITDLKNSGIVTSSGNEENPQLRINGVKVDTQGMTIIEYLNQRHIHPTDMRQHFESVVPETLLNTSWATSGTMVYINRVEFAARIGIRDKFNLVADGRRFTFEYVDDNAKLKDNHGWLYRVSVGNDANIQTREVFIPRTENKNDIPLICLGKIDSSNLPSNVRSTDRVLDAEGNTWIVANGNNFDNITNYYDATIRENSAFWQENRIFIQKQGGF